MNRIFKYSAPALGLLGLALGGCQPNIDAPAVSAGTADFSSYVAIGNSLTAGYSDGGLYLDGQLNSYPNILSQQFAKVGGGAFTQPLFTTAQANGSGYLKLTGFVNGSPVAAPVTTNLAIRGFNPAGRPLYTKFTDPVNNLGVPGIRMADIQTPGYGSIQGNPYFERITPDASALQTYLQRVQATVTALKPTFFTEWLGNNDVLGYATSGGASAEAGNVITPTATFTTNTGLVFDALVAGGAKGVVSNIPDVTGIPFFTTVGPVFKTTLTAKNVPGVIAMTGAAPGGAASGNRKQIATADIRDASGGRQLFTLISSPFLGLLGQPSGAPWRYVYGQSGKPKAGFPSFLTAFAIDTTAMFGLSVGNPIPSAFVLDDVEQGNVATATTTFNGMLAAAATARGLAYFDANAYFRGIANGGQVTNAVNNTAAYVSGNLFGLDGVHPTPRGYSLVANEILKAINAKYGSSFAGVNPNEYRGVVFPQ